MSDNTETKYWIAHRKFKGIDIDGSNDISIHEAYNYLKNKTKSTVMMREFGVQMEKNGLYID